MKCVSKHLFFSTICIALCICFIYFPSQAAESDKLVINLGTEDSYTTLQDAYQAICVESPDSGGTIYLTSNITDPNGFEMSGSDTPITLNLNGYLLTSNNTVTIASGHLTVIGSTGSQWLINSNHTSASVNVNNGAHFITEAGCDAFITIQQSNENGIGLNADNRSTVSMRGNISGGSCGVYAQNGAQVEITGNVNAGTSPNAIGAKIYKGGIIVIDGTLQAATYAQFSDSKETKTFYAADGVREGNKDRYYTYYIQGWSGYLLRVRNLPPAADELVIDPDLDGYYPLKSAKMNVSAKTLAKKDTYFFKVILNPKNATVKSITWKSSKPSIAKVNANGKVTALRKGKTTISARITIVNGQKMTVKATVQVGGKALKRVKLNAKSKTLKVGKKFRLKASLSPKNATFKDVTWKSSNTAVAKVNSKGKVTAKAKGTAIITVTTKDGNKKASCKIKVK